MKSVRQKIVLCSFLICLVSIIGIAGYDIYHSVKSFKEDVANYRQTLLDQFDRSLKLEVETALSLIVDIHQQQQKGLLTEPEAKKRATDLVRNLRFDQGNYFWIDTYQGVNVVLLGRPQEGVSRIDSKDAQGHEFIKELIANGKKSGGGYTEYSFPKPNQSEALPKRAYTLAFEPYGWIIGTGNWIDDIDKVVIKKEQEYYESLKIAIYTKLGISVLILLMAGIVSFKFGSTFSRPIENATTHVNHLAAGDFNIHFDEQDLSRSDEIGQMARSLQKMGSQLQALIQQIRSSAEHLAAASEELSAGADQSSLAIQQVATTITTMAESSTKQVSTVNTTSLVVEEITDSIDHIAQTANHLAEMSEDTAQATHGGQSTIEKAINQIRAVGQGTEDTAKAVNELKDSSAQIGAIIELISGIAGQTNLLALNAAIEAARAGEQGRGFAVVAEEVRKLAEQTENATHKIAEIIRANHENILATVSRMESAKNDVAYGIKLVNEAGGGFTNIFDMVQKLSERIRDISASLQEMAAGSQRIIQAVVELETESKHSQANAETVAAATEEQSATADEIATSSKSLAALAGNLQELTSRFKV